MYVLSILHLYYVISIYSKDWYFVRSLLCVVDGGSSWFSRFGRLDSFSIQHDELRSTTSDIPSILLITHGAFISRLGSGLVWLRGEIQRSASCYYVAWAPAAACDWSQRSIWVHTCGWLLFCCSHLTNKHPFFLICPLHPCLSLCELRRVSAAVDFIIKSSKSYNAFKSWVACIFRS